MKSKLVVLSILLTSISMPSFSQSILSGIFNQTNAAPVEDRVITPISSGSQELANESVTNVTPTPNNCIGYGSSWDKCAPVETSPVVPRTNLEATSLEPMTLPPLESSGDSIIQNSVVDDAALPSVESNAAPQISLTKEDEFKGNLTKEDMNLDLTTGAMPIKELNLNESKSFAVSGDLNKSIESLDSTDESFVNDEVQKSSSLNDRDLMIAAYPENIIRYTDKDGKLGFTNNKDNIPPGAVIETVDLNSLPKKDKEAEKKSPSITKSKTEVKSLESKSKNKPTISEKTKSKDVKSNKVKTPVEKNKVAKKPSESKKVKVSPSKSKTSTKEDIKKKSSDKSVKKTEGKVNPTAKSKVESKKAT